jgi:hypothetical protein
MSIFSLLILSGIVNTQRYPFTAAVMARPKPVLPEVLSTRVAPGLMSPASSARRTILTAMRSFTEPPGLRFSILASTVAELAAGSLWSLTSGVPPTSSSTFS